MKDNYDFSDLDAILAEFSSKGDPEAEAELWAMTVPESAPAEPVYPDTEPGRVDLEDVLIDEELARPREKAATSAAQSAPASDVAEPLPAPELPPLYTREEPAPKPRSIFHRAPREPLRASAKKEPPAAPGEPPKPSVRKAPAEAPKAPAPEPSAASAPRKKFVLPLALRIPLGLVSLFLCALVLSWTVFNLHPASTTMSYEGGDARLRLTDKLDVYVNNASADALGDLAYIRKIYTLQESDTVAPAPDPNGFGITDDLDEVQAVIEKAAVVLDGQELIFRPDVEFVPGAPFRYYLDDTIFVLAWQEYIENRCCTFAEVKVAHGSQVRRKIAGDSYSSGVQLYASTMANAANAVVAINGDFYEYRNLGITVYQRTLYRNNPATVDTCFFTASGEMLLMPMGSFSSRAEAETFIRDKDVLFSAAFGPILVKDGELQDLGTGKYKIGQGDEPYSRSAIGMTDELHYLLMTINFGSRVGVATIPEAAQIMYDKGCTDAYALDGGQTAELWMNGKVLNNVDWNAERQVSDIFYFASALPEGKGAGA